MRGVPWSEEALETARRMWAEGATCAKIGEAIGKPKNAVTGMAHSRRAEFPTRMREGDLRRDNPGGPIKTKAAKPSAKPKQVWATRSADIARARARADAEAAETRARLDAEAETPDVAEGVIAPAFRRVALVALTERTCKWPLGDPLTSDFAFCGNDAPEASPYCSFHQRLAYQPRAERAA